MISLCGLFGNVLLRTISEKAIEDYYDTLLIGSA
jgi:hypothetical protein